MQITTYTKHDHGTQILEHLQRGWAITKLEAIHRFGCMNLGGRIFDLKQRGHRIGKETIELPNGKRIAKYYLEIK